MTATSLHSPKRLTSSAPLMSRMRAEACTFEVRIGSCQPCQERALTSMSCRVIASRPAVTCSPVATTASYSLASNMRRVFSAASHQPTSWSVTPDMAETTTATSWPASTSRLTWRATLRMRSMSATEVPPNFITRRAMIVVALFHGSAPAANVAGWREKARIDTGAERRLQHQGCLGAPQGKVPLTGRILRFRRRRQTVYGGQFLELLGKDGYLVERSRRSVALTRIGSAVSCQPLATPIKLDQNAIHMSVGMTCSFADLANPLTFEADRGSFSGGASASIR